MANPCCCVDPIINLLVTKLYLEREIFERWGQVIQAFGGTPTGSLVALGNVCYEQKETLLTSILDQRAATFNRLQEVLLAA